MLKKSSKRIRKFLFIFIISFFVIGGSVLGIKNYVNDKSDVKVINFEEVKGATTDEKPVLIKEPEKVTLMAGYLVLGTAFCGVGYSLYVRTKVSHLHRRHQAKT